MDAEKQESDLYFWVVAIVCCMLLLSWWVTSASEAENKPHASLTPDFSSPSRIDLITTTAGPRMDPK